MPEVKAEFGWPSGDQPGELAFRHAVSPALGEALLKVLRPLLGEQGEVRALTPPQGAVGRYAIGGHFVRIGGRWGDPALEQELTYWLLQGGVPVNHPEWIGLPFDWEGQRLRLDVRPLLAGSHFRGTAKELAGLAHVLADGHRELWDFRGRAQVAAHAAERFAELEAWRSHMEAALAREDWTFFAADETWARRHANWLSMLTRDFHARFDLLPDAQCLHAQIHRGNVIYPDGGGAPVLLDFEWATHTLAPASWDLAYFVQRFCLHDAPSAAAIEQRLALVSEVYNGWPRGVAEMMRQTAFLSIVMVVQQWQTARVRNPPAEYDKFVFLEEQARTLEPLLERFAT